MLREGFTPFKFILDLLLKMRKIQYSTFQFHTFSTKSKLEKNVEPFSMNMSNLKLISEIWYSTCMLIWSEYVLNEILQEERAKNLSWLCANLKLHILMSKSVSALTDVNILKDPIFTKIPHKHP